MAKKHVVTTGTQTVQFKNVIRATYNPRADLKPDDPEYQDILHSLKTYGYLGGCVVNGRNNVLIAGHQRLKVMEHALGIHEAQVTVVDLDENEERKLNVILNKVTGRWDRKGLENLLTEMRENKLDLTHLGFNPIELRSIFNSAKPKPKRDPDDTAPNPPAIPYTKRGDIYELRTSDDTVHRILCGDSTDSKDWSKLMQTDKGRLIIQDPPYGVTYESKSGKKYEGKILNDELRGNGLLAFLTEVMTRLHEVTEDKVANYCFYASVNHIEFETALEYAGWKVKQQLIWIKQMVLSRSDYHWAHEPLLYCCKTAENSSWHGDRTQTTLMDSDEIDLDNLTPEAAIEILKQLKASTTIWNEKRDSANSLTHPTQKPIKLAIRAIRNSSQSGDIVIDAFSGSGSTLIACEVEGRQARVMELQEGYVDSCIQRYCETFEHATVTKNGQPYTPPKGPTE